MYGGSCLFALFTYAPDDVAVRMSSMALAESLFTQTAFFCETRINRNQWWHQGQERARTDAL